MFLILFASFISAEYRWANNSDCAETYGEPDSVYDDISLTPTGSSCYGENFNLTGLDTNETYMYNITYIFVFNITDQLADDIVYAEFCNNAPACSPTNVLETFNDTNSPVDYLTSYFYTGCCMVNYTQLQNLRLQSRYDKTGVGDANSFVDTFGIDICMENWNVYYTDCNISDARIKYYLDGNNCGTFSYLPADNGTIESCDYCSPTWKCTSYDNSCSDLITSPDVIYCLSVEATNYATCCNVTGLPSDCDYTGDYSEYDKICGDIEVVLSVPTYPFVDFNVSFPMKLYLYQDGVSTNPTNFSMIITEPDLNISVFNWTWDDSDERFELTLIFTEEGSYPFTIYAHYPYDKIQNITGTFIVRKPYYITFKFFETKDQSVKPYDNDFGFVLLEFADQQIYDQYLENFLTPLFFSTQFNKSVFHAPYIDGEGTIKLWERDVDYALRFVDGHITFDGVYSIPNMTKSYGTNMYIDNYKFNGTDETYLIYVTKDEINQYNWLLNWLFIIFLVMIISISVFLFFVIPEKPQLSIIFGLGLSSLLISFRVILWFWRGW